MKYSSKHCKIPLESNYVPQWYMGTMRRFYTQDMALGILAQNEAYMVLVLEIGLKPPHKPRSVNSC